MDIQNGQIQIDIRKVADCGLHPFRLQESYIGQQPKITAEMAINFILCCV